MSPHGKEAYKDLIYLNDAYKRAKIDSQGQEESLWDMENSLNALLWNGRGLNMCFSHGGSMISNGLKCRKQNSHGTGKTRTAL